MLGFTFVFHIFVKRMDYPIWKPHEYENKRVDEKENGTVARSF